MDPLNCHSAGRTPGELVTRFPAFPLSRFPVRDGAGWLCLLFHLACCIAAIPTPAAGLEPVTVRSQSGQFIVRGLPRGAPISGYITSAVEYVRLDPTVTTVALERVRQAVLGELGLGEKWRGLITVNLQTMNADSAPARIHSIRYTDGWGYRVDLPERINKERFLKVAVRVILSEIANRGAKVREAELPPWLPAGIEAELRATSLASFALEPETQVARRDFHPDAMKDARELLRQHPALKFDELCMPTEEQLNGDGAALYQACAQIFVRELIKLRTGRDCLREMLARLPENLNWQTTFLRTFHAHFPRLIDADKWYSLTIATFSGRDSMSMWPADVTWRQFEEILATPVQVRIDATELPIETQVSLQRIIAEWEFARQEPVLKQKINRLQALRQRAAPEASDVLDDYLQVLSTYVTGRATTGLFRGRPNAAAVVKELDGLDARRIALRGPVPASSDKR